jgi:hypothetical protein
MRPTVVTADIPAEMPAAIAMGVSVAAPHQDNFPARVDWLQRQRGRWAGQRKARNRKCNKNSDSHG